MIHHHHAVMMVHDQFHRLFIITVRHFWARISVLHLEQNTVWRSSPPSPSSVSKSSLSFVTVFLLILSSLFSQPYSFEWLSHRFTVYVIPDHSDLKNIFEKGELYPLCHLSLITTTFSSNRKPQIPSWISIKLSPGVLSSPLSLCESEYSPGWV